jgi:hypothetical protein
MFKINSALLASLTPFSPFISHILATHPEKRGKRMGNDVKKGGRNSVSDPYSFFTDPDPEAGGQYGSGYGSGSNPDPGL